MCVCVHIIMLYYYIFNSNSSRRYDAEQIKKKDGQRLCRQPQSRNQESFAAFFSFFRCW